MVELLGNTMTATYAATSPRFEQEIGGGLLPSIRAMHDSNRGGALGIHSAPLSARGSWASLPWRPNTYYSSGRLPGGFLSSRNLPEAMFEGVGQLNDRAPPVFGFSQSSDLTRYTPNDWVASNQSNYMSSDRVRGSSERMRLDISRLCREADDRTKKTQEEVGRKLGDRIGDIEHWKSELLNEIDSMKTEIESLANAKACLEKALAETESPLHIAQECLFNREKRQGIDLVHDEVEKELTKEVSNIKRCQDELKGMIQSASNQLLLNRAAKHELEKDSCDKNVASKLDSNCYQLRNSSRGLQYCSGIEQVDNMNSVPQTWVKFTNDNIIRSQNERATSRNMRSNIDQMLSKVSAAIMTQWNAANTAITERSRQYMDTRNKLQTHLARVMQEIYDMERSIGYLKKCIAEKEAPMQLAQTRLMTRTQRPNVERCRDQVHHRLLDEVYQIGDTVAGLKQKLLESENTLEHLVRTRASLEQDLNVKNNSLFIDKETCLGMRKGLPMLPRLAVY